MWAGLEEVYQRDAAVSHTLILTHTHTHTRSAPMTPEGMRRLLLVLMLGCQLMLTGACPHVCSCKASVVDCSRRGLTVATLPSSFPPHTTDLRLNDNHLTALPAGLLDSLPALRLALLHANPWSCDCGILYLRAWLLKQRDGALMRNVTCSSPAHLRGRRLVAVSEEQLLDSCRYWLCDLALASQISLFIFTAVQALLLASLVHFLRRFQRLSREAAAEDDVSREYVMLKDRDL